MKLMLQKFQTNGTHGYILQKNKIENIHDLDKYEWQKPHLPNQTGTENSYHPKKNNEQNNKKYKSWKS